MTRRDFETIARTIAGTRRDPRMPVAARALIDEHAALLADQFGLLNPLFERETFLRACGVFDLDDERERLNLRERDENRG